MELVHSVLADEDTCIADCSLTDYWGHSDCTFVVVAAVEHTYSAVLDYHTDPSDTDTAAWAADHTPHASVHAVAAPPAVPVVDNQAVHLDTDHWNDDHSTDVVVVAGASLALAC